MQADKRPHPPLHRKHERQPLEKAWMAGIATMMIGWVLVIGFKDSFQAVGARITFLTGMGFGVVSVAVIAWILYEDRWADDGGEN